MIFAQTISKLKTVAKKHTGQEWFHAFVVGLLSLSMLMASIGLVLAVYQGKEFLILASAFGCLVLAVIIKYL